MFAVNAAMSSKAFQNPRKFNSTQNTNILKKD
jgi:hypothetical protein